MSRRRRSSRSVPTWVFGAGIVVAIAAVGFVYLRAGATAGAGTPLSAGSAWLPPADAAAILDPLIPTAASSASAALPPLPRDRRDAVLAQGTLRGALDLTKPLMREKADALDEGSALLALWGSKRMTWDEIQSLPETTPLLFRRDPAEERGKRLCIRGTISEIRAEADLAERIRSDRAAPLIERPSSTTSTEDRQAALRPAPELAGGSFDWSVPEGKVYFAKIVKPSEDETPKGEQVAVAALAVRHGGQLVDGSEAHFCGVLTGATLTHWDRQEVIAHRVVGMFDLPENRALPASGSEKPD